MVLEIFTVRPYFVKRRSMHGVLGKVDGIIILISSLEFEGAQNNSKAEWHFWIASRIFVPNVYPFDTNLSVPNKV
jgi:hypothetical protein